MKAPEVNKIEGQKIDQWFDSLTTFTSESRAKDMIATVLGRTPTLKEIMKL